MLFASIALFALWLQSLRMLGPTVAALLEWLYLFIELAQLYRKREAADLDERSRAYGTSES